MASVIEICNRALALLSAEPIMALDETSRSARLCSSEYAATRDAVLRSFPWSFATKRVSLAKLAEVPAFGFSAYFALPADFIRLIEIYPGNITYEIEGRRLLANAAAVSIKYTSRAEDPNEMDPLFREVLAVKLAVNLCMPITQNGQLLQLYEQMFARRMSEARTSQSQENDAQAIDEGPWVNSRV